MLKYDNLNFIKGIFKLPENSQISENKEKSSNNEPYWIKDSDYNSKDMDE